jgi:Tetratricopeptide repeat
VNSLAGVRNHRTLPFLNQVPGRKSARRCVISLPVIIMLTAVSIAAQGANPALADGGSAVSDPNSSGQRPLRPLFVPPPGSLPNINASSNPYVPQGAGTYTPPGGGYNPSSNGAQYSTPRGGYNAVGNGNAPSGSTGGYNPADNPSAQYSAPRGGYNPADNPSAEYNSPRRVAAPVTTTTSPPTTSQPIVPRIASHGSYSIAEAQRLLEKQDWNGMASYGAGWTKDQPKSADAWYCYGQGVFHLGRYNDSVDALKTATQLNPGQPLFWDGLCAAYTGINNDALASQALAQGEAASGKNCAAINWYVFGNAAKDLDEYDHAIRDYEKALKLQPNFGACWTNMGVACELKGNKTQALQDYDKASSLGDQMGAENASRVRRRIALTNVRRPKYDPLHPTWAQTSAYQNSVFWNQVHQQNK